jgi:hypothetical protein
MKGGNILIQYNINKFVLIHMCLITGKQVLDQ